EVRLGRQLVSGSQRPGLNSGSELVGDEYVMRLACGHAQTLTARTRTRVKSMFPTLARSRLRNRRLRAACRQLRQARPRPAPDYEQRAGRMVNEVARGAAGAQPPDRPKPPRADDQQVELLAEVCQLGPRPAVHGAAADAVKRGDAGLLGLH